MYKLFLILRYLRKRRIAVVAVLSVWLCVAMVLIVISVMGGFLDMVKEKSRGLLGDLVIDNTSLQGFPYYQEFIDLLYREMPGSVVMATPVIYNYGLVRNPQTEMTKTVRVVGIRLEEYKRANDFANSLYYDKYYPETTKLGPGRPPVSGYDENAMPVLPEEYERAWQQWCKDHPDSPEISEYARAKEERFPGPGIYFQRLEAPGYLGEETDAKPGIIIGTDLINERLPNGEYYRFDPRGTEFLLTLMPLTARGTLVEGGKPLSRAMYYVDDSRTGVYEIDSICVYVDFELVQGLLSMSPQERVDGGMTQARASQILIDLADGQDAKLTVPRVRALWDQFTAQLDPQPEGSEARLLAMVDVETWEERQAPFIAAVEKEKVLVTLLFCVISLVAVALIGCVFYMLVSQKIRDIGIIKSLGASSEGIAGIFVGFGATVGIVGAVLGITSGVVFVYYINDIQSWLASLNPALRVWTPEVYTFDRIPNHVKFSEALTIGIAAVIMSMLGAAIPALLASRVWPAKTLRYE